MNKPGFIAAAICPAGETRDSFTLGLHRIHVTATETGGTYGVWEEVVEPTWGPPMHVHEAEDEMFHVLEGRVRIWCGDETFDITTGATAVLPRGIPHRFENVGESVARMLISVTPGGFESFFLDLSALAEPTEAAIVALGARYKLTFLPPTQSEAA
jgi:mannose-6-phosphate isomerase-like protein (cupin superfamily)